jgi:hypothetical protein
LFPDKSRKLAANQHIHDRAAKRMEIIGQGGYCMQRYATLTQSTDKGQIAQIKGPDH